MEDGTVAGSIAEGDILQFQGGGGGEENAFAVGLGGQVFEFLQAVDGGKGIDHGGYQTRKVENRALHFPHQLQESGHGAEGDAAGAEAYGSPEKCREVTARKGEGHKHASGKREARAPHDLTAERVLQVVELVEVAFALFQGFDDCAVLQALLDDGLYAAVAVSDIVRVAFHAAHVEAASQQEDGNDGNNEPRQRWVQKTEEEESGHQLHAGDDECRDGSSEQTDDGRSVLLHAVHHVSRVETFQLVPAALQQPREEAVAQGIPRFYLHAGAYPRVGGAAQQLGYE